MKKTLFLMIGASLLVGVSACDNNAKTSSSAPDDVTGTGAPLTADKAQSNKADATSDLRRRQLNADIRAKEQRNDIVGDQSKRTDGDIESEVRSKLEANIPSSQLTVDSKDGAVKVGGSVTQESQVAKIKPLAEKILGVKSVVVEAKVAAAKAK